MIVLGNRIEFVTTYLAVLRAQAVAVPVNPTSQAGELARMINPVHRCSSLLTLT
jgi:long-chain acyl-CoA synthetase